MAADNRYCTSIWTDEKTYVENADYRDFIAKRIQDDLAKVLITALCTKDAIIAIKGDSTTRKDEYTCGICCQQDIYVKELVRCKDCKYWDNHDGGERCTNIVGLSWARPENFCNYGDRKDEVKK